MAGTRKRVKYNEGDWFAVPLTNGQFGLGLVSRVDRKMREIIGYFFADIYAEVPVLLQAPVYSPNDAVLTCWVVDRGIVEGQWPIVLASEGIDKQKWLVPIFGQQDAAHPEMGYCFKYNDENPSHALEQARTLYVPWIEVAHLPSNGLYGHIALERVLSMILLEGRYPPQDLRQVPR